MPEKKYDLHDNDLMIATEASLRWRYDLRYVKQMEKSVLTKYLDEKSDYLEKL